MVVQNKYLPHQNGFIVEVLSVFVTIVLRGYVMCVIQGIVHKDIIDGFDYFT